MKKFIKTFESFINEDNSAVLKQLQSSCKGAKFTPGEMGETPDGVKKAIAFDVEHPEVEDYGFSVQIYDDKSFVFYYDASPVPTSLHSDREKRNMTTMLGGGAMPLSELTPKVWDSVLKYVMVD